MNARPIFAAKRDPCELAAPEPTLADVITAIGVISASVDALHADVARLLAKPRLFRRRNKLTAADRAKAAHLLSATAESWGAGREFSVSELRQFAAALATRRELREALASVGTDPRRIGLFLRRVAGVPAGGHVLERIGDDRSGAVWSVRELRGT